jgi:hypothetical protein
MTLIEYFDVDPGILNPIYFSLVARNYAKRLLLVELCCAFDTVTLACEGVVLEEHRIASLLSLCAAKTCRRGRSELDANLCQLLCYFFFSSSYQGVRTG